MIAKQINQFDKLWLSESYPADVPHEIDINQYSSLAHLFNVYSNKFADKTAFINMGTELSYKQLHKKSSIFAAYLQQDLNLKKGDKFALMIPNTLQYPIALFGALLAGLTVVNVNPQYSARELKHQLIDSEAKAILIVENFADTLAKVVDETAIEQTIVTKIGDCLGPVKGAVTNFLIRHVKKLVPPYQLAQSISFKQVMTLGQQRQFDPVEINADDLAFLQYTGGTTGLAKGAMLTHSNMLANIEQAKAVLMPIFKQGEELVVTALPLYHIFALTANCLMFFTIGGKNLLITNPKDIKGFVKELSKYPFTALSGVNTLFNALLKEPSFTKLNFDSLKLSLGGGMSVHQTVAENWQRVTNTCLLEGYGLTETSPILTVCPYNQTAYNGSIGIPVPSTNVKIINSAGQECQIGEPGELIAKGPQIMKGYFNKQQATDDILTDGWLATGDIATMDEQGVFRIVDRKKDMIIVSGFNVFPNEIEDIITLIDGIDEAAVIGKPHPISGETVKAFIVKTDDDIDQADIIKHCKNNLANYKVPRDIEFVTGLPKSNVGKILRKELR